MDALPDVAYVYMVRCTGGQLYTGWTNHPAARLKAHQSGKGARYTRAHGAVGFAYLERCADKRAALRREAALKKLSKAEKEVLCAAWRAAGCPGCRTIENALRAFRVAAPSIRFVPWAALASCWPLPQQLLPVSATGGGRRRCSGRIILILGF